MGQATKKKAKPESPALFTAGYEGLPVAAFLARLKAAGIGTVIDVRERPLSRKKGYSKTAFAAALAKAGIAYEHRPALGCPKPIRDALRESGDWASYARAFDRYLAGQTAEVAALARDVRRTRACLVCFEADFGRCHRRFVARAATQAGAPPVVHLTAGVEIPEILKTG
ncbi:MAG: DUF488 domain-containing protein [Proteobacteria bacterium]|nr:DUF488 domain-containing protein [Pseudomonadota bacterium]